MKATVISIVLLLLIFTVSYGQKKLSTEILFKEYLNSLNDSIAKKIIASNDNLYSIYCEAALSKNIDEKINGYSSFIALKPRIGIATAYVMRGLAYTSAEKQDSALPDFKSATLLDTTDAYAYYFLGSGYMFLKETDSAMKALSRAIYLNPGLSLAYHLRAICYEYKKEYTNAIADLTEEIKLDKKSDMAYMTRGYIYNDIGNYPKAIKDWKQAEKLNPDNTKAADELIEKALDAMNNQ